MTIDDICNLIHTEIHRLAGAEAVASEGKFQVSDKIISLAEIRSSVRVGITSIEEALVEMKELGCNIEKP